MPGYVDPRRLPQGIGLPDFGPSVVEQMQANSRRVQDVARTQGWGAAMRDPVSGQMGRDIAEQFNFSPAGIGLGTIRAYHGSPHVFDKFSMEHIGTGEGAQAYGRGLYFAENPAVAESYQKGLSGPQAPLIDGKPPANPTEMRIALQIANSPGSADKQIKDIRSMIDWMEKKKMNLHPRDEAWGDLNRWDDTDEQSLAGYKDELRNWLAMKDREVTRPTTEGAFYQADLDVNHEDLLDYDLPLPEQPEKVRKALEGLGFRHTPEIQWSWEARPDGSYALIRDDVPYAPQGFLKPNKTGGYDMHRPGSSGYFGWAGTLEGGKESVFEKAPKTPKNPITPRTIYSNLVTQTGDASGAAAAQKLREAGIPGIRYSDQGSRGSREGTRNIVMFDDALIKILERNGIGLGK